jgi:hypothetical protein
VQTLKYCSQMLLHVCRKAMLHMHAGSADEAALPRPGAPLEVAARSRDVKVYVYDMAAVGLVPPLNLTAATSHACACVDTAGTVWYADGQVAVDPCNHCLGKLRSTSFARAYQGNYWSNHHEGLDLSKMMRGRMEGSHRRVWDVKSADLFFIPVLHPTFAFL